jgi:hypothetical protein
MPRGGYRKGSGRKRTKPEQKPVKARRPRTVKPAKPPKPAAIKESNPPEIKESKDQKPIQTSAPDASRLTSIEKQALFLEEYARCGSVLRSCQRVGVARSTLYGDWIKGPEFKAAFEKAGEDATDVLEEEARRRAVDGTVKPVYQGGKMVGGIREYSDSLLMFLLRGKRDAFREKRSIGVGFEGSTAGGVRKVIVEIDETPGAQP